MTTATDTDHLAEIRALVQQDLAAVDRLIENRLHSEVVLINQVAQYIVQSGGKRLRPLLVLLGAHAFDYQGDAHIELAAIIEFIHTATLLHDDVVDASDLRRGQETANTVWGNEASVLVGDFLYSRAFQMMVQVNSMQVMQILADTTNVISEGEVMQLLNCHDPETSEEQYLRVIRAKTAKLFEAAAQLGAVLCERPLAEQQAMAACGSHLGIAYQLIDDVLDYRGSPDEIGKNVGDDIAEGKPTLPLIYAMRHGSEQQVGTLRRAIQEGGREAIESVITAVESTGAIAYTARAASSEANLALSALDKVPPTPYRDALKTLVEFSVNRSY